MERVGTGAETERGMGAAERVEPMSVALTRRVALPDTVPAVNVTFEPELWLSVPIGRVRLHW